MHDEYSVPVQAKRILTHMNTKIFPTCKQSNEELLQASDAINMSINYKPIIQNLFPFYHHENLNEAAF